MQPPSQPDASDHALPRAVRSVSGMTLLSRFGGLARDLLLARVFGASAVGSAFGAGFAVPNMFRRLFGEGALSAAFIPEYTQAHKSDPQLAGRVASLTVLVLLLATAAATVLIELTLLAVLWITPANPGRTLSIQLIMLMLPYMPLVCAAAMLAGMLQVHGRFAPAASGPLLLNAFIIAAGVYYVATGRLGGRGAAYVLGGVTVASGLTQCAWFLLLLRPHVRWSRVFTGAGPRVRSMLGRFIPAVIGMGTLQINAFLDMLIAMWPIWVGPTLLGMAYPLDEKSNSILMYTQRLYQFPLGVFGIAVATAVFPMLSRHADDAEAFARTLRRGLRLSLFIGLPASVGLVLVRRDLAATLFSGGQSGFSADDLARCASVVLGFAPAIWAYSLNHVFTRAFYARGDTSTPMRIALAMVGLNLALNLVLIWPLREAGLAWSTSLAAMAQCAILARLFGPSRVFDRETIEAGVRIAIATLAMAGVVALVLWLVPRPSGWWGNAVGLAAGCVAGLTAFGGASVAVGAPELRWLLHRG